MRFSSGIRFCMCAMLSYLLYGAKLYELHIQVEAKLVGVHIERATVPSQGMFFQYISMLAGDFATRFKNLARRIFDFDTTNLGVPDLMDLLRRGHMTEFSRKPHPPGDPTPVPTNFPPPPATPVPACQMHRWRGFNTLPPRHRVITLNIACHRRLPPLRACQESPRRAPKTIRAHLNISSSLLSEPPPPLPPPSPLHRMFFFFQNLSHPIILPYLSLIHHSPRGSPLVPPPVEADGALVG